MDLGMPIHDIRESLIPHCHLQTYGVGAFGASFALLKKETLGNMDLAASVLFLSHVGYQSLLSTE